MFAEIFKKIDKDINKDYTRIKFKTFKHFNKYSQNSFCC